MSITVRYFASLRETLGRSHDVIEAKTALTVEQVWQQANPNQSIPSNILAAVNMDYVSLTDPVVAGDEVAFFPPVTGG